jgi:anion-transporting  ArsA/GET3 family ATPase
MTAASCSPDGDLHATGTARLDALVRTKRVLVLCGAGGVGKTTTSAALALAGAQAGRRVLILTVDPARRLGEALGIPAGSTSPTAVPAERLQAAGLDGAGRLDAWMLDPRVVFDRLVRRLSTPAHAEKILQSRLYRHLSELVAGMQEYTAAEALYELSSQGVYDLVVLDTPPSRNALDFLDAPGRLTRFLEDGIVQLFLPGEGGGLLRRAGRLVSGVFSRVFGDAFLEEMSAFLAAFSGMFAALRAHGEGVRALLASDDAASLLVTSPEEEALREALFFRDQISARDLPFAGFVLNRSLATLESLAHPDDVHAPTATLREALNKLRAMAEVEHARAKEDGRALDRLRQLAGAGRLAVAAPHLGEAIEDLPGLLRLARAMAG